MKQFITYGIIIMTLLVILNCTLQRIGDGRNNFSDFSNLYGEDPARITNLI
jgi:hypothetical protein